MTYTPTPYGLNGRPRPAFGRAGAKATPQATWQPRRGGTPTQEPSPQAAPYAEPVYADGSLRISRILSRMLDVLRSNFVTFLALIAIFAAPERIAYHAFGANSHLAVALGKFALAVGGFALQIAVIHLSLRRFARAPAGFGACVVNTLKAFFPALFLCFLAGLAIGAAAFLLIVPCVMLSTAWAVLLPAYMAEGGFFASFGRSAQLTKGHRWKIFAILLLLGAALGVIAMTLMPIWGMHGVFAMLLFFNQNWLMHLVTCASTGLVLASIYRELAGTPEAEAF